jgi:hypothetical protein
MKSFLKERSATIRPNKENCNLQ